ncbi:hypothetical protein ACWIT3_01140 [Pasteurella sp. P03HT]
MKFFQYFKFFALACFAISIGLDTYAQALADNPSSQQVVPLTKKQIEAIEKKMIGNHKLSLQWVSWEKFGLAEIYEGPAGLMIEGEQYVNDNYVILKGLIEVIDERAFKFSGMIITRVDHIHHGNECERVGEFEFRATGKRKYWRLQQMANPCDQATDYVDVFF